jgi:hypothetical protein
MDAAAGLIEEKPARPVADEDLTHRCCEPCPLCGSECVRELKGGKDPHAGRHECRDKGHEF